MTLPRGIDDPGDNTGLRTNSDLREWNGFGAARYQGVSGEWLGLSAVGYAAERGVPPELHVAEPRLWRYRTPGGS